MGDENSLQGSTKAHKHSAVSSDGGFLETSVTGVTNLSNGSMVYGDASEIVTELASGTTGDVLTMGASVPQWVTPAGASGVFTKLADITQNVAGGGALASGTFAGHDFLQIYVMESIQSFPTGGWECSIKFNSSAISSGLYSVNFQKNDGTVLSQRNSPTANAMPFDWTVAGGNLDWNFLRMDVVNLDGMEKLCNYQSCRPLTTGNATPYVMVDGGSKYTVTAGQITSVQICDETGKDTGDRIFKQGSRLIVLGL